MSDMPVRKMNEDEWRLLMVAKLSAGLLQNPFNIA